VSRRSQVRLVARRDALAILRSRYFQVSLAIQVLIVLALVVVSSLEGEEQQKFTVAVAGSEAAMTAIADQAKSLANADGVAITVERETDAEAVEAAVEDGDADAGLAKGSLVAKPDADEQLAGLIQAAASREGSAAFLKREGLPESKVDAALSPPPLQVHEVDSGDEGSGTIAFIGGLLLYLSLLFAGYMVAGGIAEEKSSRVIELLLAAVRPINVFVGKIVGIGLVSLLQIAVTVGAGLIAALALGEIDLPATTADVAILVVVYFALGYALYGCAFAVAGSIVSRQEDIQSTTSPLMILLVAGYIVSFSVTEDPAGGLAQALTFVPPLAPLIVPARAAEGALPAGELVISLVLMLAAIVLVARLGARIYERSVLRMGAPLKLSEALRLARRS
jgi:ABC-2 type transport system permease protein